MADRTVAVIDPFAAPAEALESQGISSFETPRCGSSG
jgi:hypothetical protein